MITQKLNNWFDNRVKESWNRARNSQNYVEEGAIKMGTLMAGQLATGIESRGFNLKVVKANGGTIVEVSRYEISKDRNGCGVYVITDDKDLGDEIGKIITMEGLK